MATVTKTFDTLKKHDWKPLQVFALDKIQENAWDYVVTLITAAITILVIVAMQPIPVTLAEMIAYITLLFVLLLTRRVVQDFDNEWTIDEVGNRIASSDNKLDDITRMIRNETILTADDDEHILNDRMNKIANEI